MIYAHLTQDHIKSQMGKLDGVSVPEICPKSAQNPLKVKKGNPRKTGFPLMFAMVPKAGFEPPRVSPPPPQAALPLKRHSNLFTYRTVTAAPA